MKRRVIVKKVKYKVTGQINKLIFIAEGNNLLCINRINLPLHISVYLSGAYPPTP